VQRVPELLLSIKEDVDRNRQPGRYILTGSSDVLTIPAVSDSLAGRIELLTLWPLSVGEILGNGDNIVDLLFDREFPGRLRASSEFDFEGSIVSGGFPEPVKRASHRRRLAWFESYVTTILDRDIRNISQIQDLASVPKLLKLLAGRVGTLHNQSEISRSSGIPNSTLVRYITLLKSTFLIQELPAWSANLGKRLVKSPKLYMVDTGLACHLIDIGKDGLKKAGEVAGRIFENFVVLELFKYASWSDEPVRLYHFRSQSGKEVDIIIEDRKGNIVGVEVKLSATPSKHDFSGLKVLRDHLGEKFIRGIVIFTGDEIVPFDDNLHAIPVYYM